MAQYKYLFERPLADARTAEKLRDFDSILSRSVRFKRISLIRNTVIVTVLATIGIVGIIYLLQGSSPTEPQIETTIPPVGKDSAIAEPKPEEQFEHRESHKLDTLLAKPSINEIPDEKSDVEPRVSEKPDDKGYKIQESFPNEQVIIQAEPQAGFDHLYEYFNSVLTYPGDLAIEQIEGNLVVEFMIKSDGKVGNIKLLNKLHPVLDSIAIASVKNMPTWNPASVNGEKVDTKHSIPLLFNIGN